MIMVVLLLLLLLFRNTYKGKSKYYVRDLKNLFVVGQTFPMQEVPSPPSRKAKTIANTRIQVAAFRYMKKNKHHLLIQDKLTKKFPDYSLQTLRGRLKVYLIYLFFQDDLYVL